MCGVYDDEEQQITVVGLCKIVRSIVYQIDESGFRIRERVTTRRVRGFGFGLC